MTSNESDFFASVVYIYSVDKGKVLTVTRKDSLKICVVGGKIEKGESLVAAACREIFEECGLLINNRDLLSIHGGVDDHDHLTRSYLVFYDKDLHGIPETKEKGINVSWSNENDLLSDKSEFMHFNKTSISIARILYMEKFKEFDYKKSKIRVVK